MLDEDLWIKQWQPCTAAKEPLVFYLYMEWHDVTDRFYISDEVEATSSVSHYLAQMILCSVESVLHPRGVWKPKHGTMLDISGVKLILWEPCEVFIRYMTAIIRYTKARPVWWRNTHTHRIPGEGFSVCQAIKLSGTDTVKSLIVQPFCVGRELSHWKVFAAAENQELQSCLIKSLITTFGTRWSIVLCTHAYVCAVIERGREVRCRWLRATCTCSSSAE